MVTPGTNICLCAVIRRVDQNIPVHRVHVASILAASTLVTFTFSPVHPNEGPSVAELLGRHDEMLDDMSLHNHIVDLVSSAHGPTIEVSVQNTSLRINQADRVVMPASIVSQVKSVDIIWDVLCCSSLELESVALTPVVKMMEESGTVHPVLVLGPYSLAGDSQYRFRLTAKKNGFSYSDSVLVDVNSGPVNGSIEVSPAIGQALITTFQLTASGWYDVDTPLWYRYVWRVRPSHYAWLTARSASASGSVILSTSSFNADVIVAVVVGDSFGAETLLEVIPGTVEVNRYDLNQGLNHHKNLTAMVNEQMARVDTVDIYGQQQIIQALSSGLRNVSMAGDNSDVVAARLELIKQLSGIANEVQPMASDRKTSVLMTLQLVTDIADQMNDAAIETSMELVDSLLAVSTADQDLPVIAQVVSNLLGASQISATEKALRDFLMPDKDQPGSSSM